MSHKINQWQSGEIQTLLWIDYEHYAWRVFANQAKDWYHNVIKHSGTLSQALGVIKTDVLAIDVITPYLEQLQQNDTTAHESLLTTLEDNETAFQFITDLLDALAHSVGEKVDLVLKTPALSDIWRACGAPDNKAQDFDALDDLANALVNLLRRLADKPIKGLLLVSSQNRLSEDEDEAGEPIWATAAYYGWATALSLSGQPTDDAPETQVDVLLYPQATVTALNRANKNNFGGGFVAEFWTQQTPLETTDKPMILHGTIPADANPEAVIETVAILTD